MILICLLLAPCGKEISIFLCYQKEISQTVCRDSVATKESVLSVVSVCPYSSGISGTSCVFKKWRFSSSFSAVSAAYYVFQEMALFFFFFSGIIGISCVFKKWRYFLLFQRYHRNIMYLKEMAF